MKIVLIDADGVVIRPRHKYFSEKLSKERHIPLDSILPFFKGDYKKAARGEVDIKTILPEYLKKCGWTGGVDAFLKYWFEGEKDLDEKVLQKIRYIRNTGVKVYLVSDNEKYRSEYLMNTVGLEKEFDGSFFSYQLGVTKNDPEFFLKILNTLGTDGSDVIYFDDDPKNVEVGEKAGIRSVVYANPEQLNGRH